MGQADCSETRGSEDQELSTTFQQSLFQLHCLVNLVSVSDGVTLLKIMSHARSSPGDGRLGP